MNKITGQDGTVRGTTGLRAAQADQQLSYVTLDVETTPTQREFPVPLGVRTASDAERAIILLGPVPAENRIVLVGKSELQRVTRTQARATQRRRLRQPKRSTSLVPSNGGRKVIENYCDVAGKYDPGHVTPRHASRRHGHHRETF